jgi:hypothetical protein
MLYDSYPVSLEAQLADLEGDGVLVSSVSFGAETIVRVQTSPLAYGEADGDDVVLTCWTPPRYSRPSVSALAVLWDLVSSVHPMRTNPSSSWASWLLSSLEELSG